jgi:hypothetical protein
MNTKLQNNKIIKLLEKIIEQNQQLIEQNKKFVHPNSVTPSDNLPVEYPRDFHNTGNIDSPSHWFEQQTLCAVGSDSVSSSYDSTITSH